MKTETDDGGKMEEAILSLHWKDYQLFMGQICVGSIWGNQGKFFLSFPDGFTFRHRFFAYNNVNEVLNENFYTEAEARYALVKFVRDQSRVNVYADKEKKRALEDAEWHAKEDYKTVTPWRWNE